MKHDTLSDRIDEIHRKAAEARDAAQAVMEQLSKLEQDLLHEALAEQARDGGN